MIILLCQNTSSKQRQRLFRGFSRDIWIGWSFGHSRYSLRNLYMLVLQPGQLYELRDFLLFPFPLSLVLSNKDTRGEELRD